MTHQCLIEESILGWEELEVEVVRDSKNQMVAICTIENIDAVGVHTGDSFCAAPFMTIDKDLGVPRLPCRNDNSSSCRAIHLLIRQSNIRVAL